MQKDGEQTLFGLSFAQVVSRRSAVPCTRARAGVVVRAADRNLWAPGVEAPEYLNGDLAGDYGACFTTLHMYV